MENIKVTKPEVLESEYLSREPWFTVRRDKLRQPNGHIVPAYYVLEYPAWVNVIAVTKDQRFVFIRQYRHGLGEIGYELCAGVCEESDLSPLAAAQRELAEETGYGNGTWEELMVISGNPSTTNNLTHCFVAKDVEKVSGTNWDYTEYLEVHLLTLDEVKGLLGTDQVKQSLMAAPLWKYMAVNKL